MRRSCTGYHNGCLTHRGRHRTVAGIGAHRILEGNDDFSRALEQVLEDRRLRKEREREEREEARRREFEAHLKSIEQEQERWRQQLIDRGIAIGMKRGYEKGRREAINEMRENGEKPSSDRSDEAPD